MKKRYSVLKCWVLFASAVLTASFLLFTLLYIKIRPLICIAARNKAEAILLNAESRSMLDIMNEKDISYESLAVVSEDELGNIKGIEIDIKNIAMLKNSISSYISEEIAENQFYSVSISLGTLSGIEYFSGLGPRIKFPMQLAAAAVVDYKSKFAASGINNTLHQIIINTDLKCNIIMFGMTDSFSVSTSEIAAQTVIVGETPDSFTNVIETPVDDIADEIFNYVN